MFIVLDGIDGAGTTTHTRLLSRSLRDQGHRVHATREPSDGPIGVLIRQALTHRLVQPRADGNGALPWDTMALLFAADRLDHVQAEVAPALDQGQIVLSDRYDYSSIAYQSLAGEGQADAMQWVRELNSRARRPDLAIMLNVDAEVAAARRGERFGAPELYERQALQVKLAEFYRHMDDYFDDSIAHVDANQDRTRVAEQILALVEHRLREAKVGP